MPEIEKDLNLNGLAIHVTVNPDLLKDAAFNLQAAIHEAMTDPKKWGNAYLMPAPPQPLPPTRWYILRRNVFFALNRALNWLALRVLRVDYDDVYPDEDNED